MIIRSLYIVASINFKVLNFVIFFNCINMVGAVLMMSQVRRRGREGGQQATAAMEKGDGECSV